MHSIFQISISRNTKCVGFRKSGHIYSLQNTNLNAAEFTQTLLQVYGKRKNDYAGERME